MLKRIVLVMAVVAVAAFAVALTTSLWRRIGISSAPEELTPDAVDVPLLP